jgi:hypothetical protein
VRAATATAERRHEPASVVVEPNPTSEAAGDQVTTGARVNIWGLGAITLVGLGWSVAGMGLALWPAKALSAAGLAVAACGMLAPKQRPGRDAAWLGAGACMSLAMLAVLFCSPHWLAPRWEMDFDVPGPRPHELLLVGRDGQ